VELHYPAVAQGAAEAPGAEPAAEPTPAAPANPARADAQATPALPQATEPSPAATSIQTALAQSPTTLSDPSEAAADPAVPLSSLAGQTNHAAQVDEVAVPLSSQDGQRIRGMDAGEMGRPPLAAAPGDSPLAAAPATGPLADLRAGDAAAGEPATGPAAAPAPSAPTTRASLTGSAPPPSPGAALGATIRLAAERGFSRARLTLRPAELGSVDVVLKAGAGGGVSASVVAGTPQAARLLEAAGHDLKRRLEAHGIELQALKVSVAGDAATGAGGEPRPRTGAPGPRGATSPASGSPDRPPTSTRQIELGGGVLVDVLA
jgi:flagellar hook-length control protein FliK